jgi:glycosyltransferase involved in cell wall biosynthesis
MQKLLYITDQNEYVDHSFITPLFEVYLKKHMDVDILYFTDFKSDFECKDSKHFVMPSCYKTVLLAELKCNNIDLASYDFVMVRNNIELMKHVLKYKAKYGYKSLYRFSYPKRKMHIKCEEAKGKNQFLNRCLHYLKTKNETKVINSCDAFLPTSARMQEIYRPDVSIPSIVCSPAMNPAALHTHQQHEGEEIHFVYVGTLDEVRAFDTILDAFSSLANSNWKLFISTRDVEFAYALLEKYPLIKEKVKVYNAKTKDALLELIAKTDIGIALLPDLPIYSTSTPVKVFDYYASGVPCLMTQSGHTANIFTDCVDAWFSDFSVQTIEKKLCYILTLSKDDIAALGDKGQKRLLDVKNYEVIAKNIADQLKAL